MNGNKNKKKFEMSPLHKDSKNKKRVRVKHEFVDTTVIFKCHRKERVYRINRQCSPLIIYLFIITLNK